MFVLESRTFICFVELFWSSELVCNALCLEHQVSGVFFILTSLVCGNEIIVKRCRHESLAAPRVFEKSDT